MKLKFHISKRYFTTILILLLISPVSAFSKVNAAKKKSVNTGTSPIVSKIPVQPSHEKKVYLSPDKTVYWPLNKPVWIRLAPSARDDAPSFLLNEVYKVKSDKRKTRANDKKQAKKMPTSGLKLDVTGAQFIRWLNYISKEETLYKFVSDGVPPNSWLKLSGASKHTLKSQVVYGPGLKGRILAQDDLAGVKSSFFSIDGNPYSIYQKELSFDQERPYFIWIYSVDKVGYAEKPKVFRFNIDHTPPLTIFKKQENYIDNILSNQTRIYLSSTDNLAGIQQIYYKFGTDKKFKRYNKKRGINMIPVRTGENILTFYSTDNVNNAEIKNNYKFYLDRDPPIVRHQFIGTLYKGKKHNYVSPQTRIILQGTDDKAGVKQFEYQINKLKYKKYIDPFTPPFETGPFTVRYKAIDKLGNVSKPHFMKLMMDIKPPVTEHTITGRSHSTGGGVIWINSNTRISLKTGDDLSGVKKTEFQIADQPPQIYKKPIQIKKAGQFLFRYWGTDQVDNKEMFSPTLLIVDNTPPRIMEVFSIESSDKKVINGKTFNIFPLYTTLFINALDNSAGLGKMHFSVNGAPKKEYRKTMVFTKEGKYEIKLWAEDNVGNIAKKTIQFLIKKR